MSERTSIPPSYFAEGNEFDDFFEHEEEHETDSLQSEKPHVKESSSSDDDKSHINEEAGDEEGDEEEEVEEVLLRLQSLRPEGHVRIQEQLTFRDKLLNTVKKPRKSSLRHMSLASVASAESLVIPPVTDEEGGGDLFSRYYEFFEHFWDIPNMEDIELSSSTSEETIVPTKSSATSLASKKLRESESMKYGQFFENLDDTSQEISTDETAQEKVIDAADEEADTEEDDDSTFSSETDELLKKPSGVHEETEQTLDDDRILALFEKIDVDNRQQEQDDIQAIVEQQRQEERTHTVGRFLDQLLHSVVNYCEEKDEAIVMRNDLDKMSIVQAMVDSHFQLMEAQRKRLYLNRKVVEFYRRKRQFRQIAENVDTLSQDMPKYLEALHTLDVNLNRENLIRKIVDAQVSELKVESASLHVEAQRCIKEFEDCVRSTMCHDTGEKNNRLNAVVDYMLRKRNALSKEVSKVRLKLILRQHLLASLRKSLDELEDLGNGLHMSDFERLSAETTNLTKKIEERTIELNRVRTRCNRELHEMSHKRERQSMVRQTVAIQKSMLKELIDEKDENRAWLHNLKLKRIKIRATIKELSFQGGLIDKPALMKDYDETAEKKDRTRARNDILKKKLADLQQRYETYVDKLLQLERRKSAA